MPFNALQQLDRVRFEVREQIVARYTDRRILDILNEAHREIARAAYCVTRELMFEATTGVTHYPFAKYVDDFLAMRKVDWRDTTLGEFTDIERWVYGKVGRQQTNQREIRLVGIEEGSLVVFPAPSVTRYTGATVTVTQDSVTVTVTAGTPGANGATKGWIFGVGATPSKWYAVKSVSDTAGTITLQEPYREETAAGQVCVVSGGAIRLVYAALPEEMRLLSDGGTRKPYYSQGTVAFTNGSATVAGTATSWGSEIRGSLGGVGGGMEIGHGTSTALPPSHQWLKIRSKVSTTSLRVTKPWTFETDGAASAYVLCDESPFAPNEEWSQAAIYYAARECFLGAESGANDAARMDGMYQRALNRVKSDVVSIMGKRSAPPPKIILPYHGFFGGRV